MKAEAWRRVKKLIQQGRLSLCAWCRRPYSAQGVAGTQLTDEQYREIESHGICASCKTAMLAETAETSAGKPKAAK